MDRAAVKATPATAATTRPPGERVPVGVAYPVELVEDYGRDRRGGAPGVHGCTGGSGHRERRGCQSPAIRRLR